MNTGWLPCITTGAVTRLYASRRFGRGHSLLLFFGGGGPRQLCEGSPIHIDGRCISRLLPAVLLVKRDTRAVVPEIPSISALGLMTCRP